MDPWNNPTNDDHHYQYHILSENTPDSFQKKFNFSDEMCVLLRRIFQKDPFSRPSANELLERFLELDGFFINSGRGEPRKSMEVLNIVHRRRSDKINNEQVVEPLSPPPTPKKGIKNWFKKLLK